MDSKNELELQPKQTGSSPLLADINSYTQSNIINCSFKWTIDNFLQLPDHPSLQSEFSFKPKHDSEWIMTLYPRSPTDEESAKMIIRLKSLTPNMSEAHISSNFFLLDSTGELVRLSETSFSKRSVGVDYSFHFKRSLFQNKEKEYLPNRKLTIIWKLEILSSLETNSSTLKDQITIPTSTLAGDFSSLLYSAKFSDAALVVGSQEFPVHKNILAARSDVFAAMFEHEFEEQKSNRVPITDIDADVVKEMLRFIYTGEAPNVQEMANRLISAADKYLLNGLKLICEKALHLGLSNENACGTFILADRHNAKKLKMKTIDFIIPNIKQIKATFGWKALSANLLDELLNVLAEKEVKIVKCNK